MFPLHLQSSTSFVLKTSIFLSCSQNIRYIWGVANNRAQHKSVRCCCSEVELCWLGTINPCTLIRLKRYRTVNTQEQKTKQIQVKKNHRRKLRHCATPYEFSDHSARSFGTERLHKGLKTSSVSLGRHWTGQALELLFLRRCMILSGHFHASTHAARCIF